MTARPDFDVVVAGASIAGCTAARLFALAGARVALVEQRPDPSAHKVICTHGIQSSAAPTIARIGLGPLLERRAAVRISTAAWSPHGGWLRFPDDAPRGYSVTRRTLDPILRELAAQTPGVELLCGHRVAGLREESSGVGGVEVETPAGLRRTLSARLTVAADGRESTVARLAGTRARVSPNQRFFYFAYWRGIRPTTTTARFWFLEPDGAGAFPDEDDLTVIATAPHRSRLPEFRADAEAAYLRMVRALPDGPDIDGAERVSKLLGKLDVPNKLRRVAQPGLAFVGDAALATDPFFGVGCGWAFQSAEWLVDCTAAAALGGAELEPGLGRYRRTFARRILPHQLQIADFSSRRMLRASQRLAFRAAARDPVIGRAFEEFATRRRTLLRMLDPRLQPRALRAVL